MRTFVPLTLMCVAVASVFCSTNALAQGTMSVPLVDTPLVETQIEVVPIPGTIPEIIYRYTVTNPATSNDALYFFSVDISGERRDFFNPSVTTIPKGRGTTTIPYGSEFDFFFPYFGSVGAGLVSIGLECPSGWNGGFRKSGIVACNASTDAPQVEPGSAMAGFTIFSRRYPTLREINAKPFWNVVVDSEEDISDADREAAFATLKGLDQRQMGIGPTNTSPGERRHFVNLKRDLTEMISLGWIPDTALAGVINQKLEDALALFDGFQGSQAKLLLQDVIDLIDTAVSPQDINDNARLLLTVNLAGIIEFALDSVLGGFGTRHYDVNPTSASLPVGNTVTVEVFVFLEREVVEPIVGDIIYFGCDKFADVEPGVDPCPNFADPDARLPIISDSNGIASFSLTSTVVGRDHVEICSDTFCEGLIASVPIDWTSDVDLVVSGFSPPLILAAEGETIRITDLTTNRGDAAAPQSVTRFYISDDAVVDPGTAVVLGERLVPILQPGETSEEIETFLTIPAGFQMEFHNLVACADSDLTIAESNEFNNCSDAQIDGLERIAIPVADAGDIPVISILDAEVAEGNSGQTLISVDVELSQSDPVDSFVVAFSTADDTATIADNDYVPVSGELTFLMGSGPQIQQIVVPIVGDTNVEEDEVFSIQLVAISDNVRLLDDISVVTIANDDIDAVLDCSTVQSSPNILWPPNHMLVDVTLSGIVDGSGNGATITALRVEQDEIVEGVGDGNTHPDAIIDAAGGVRLRRERSGLEDGRVYEIHFQALSDDGGMCTGSVLIGVPHDKGTGSVAIDSLVRYDSTIPPY